MARATLDALVAGAPRGPGVYLMKGGRGGSLRRQGQDIRSRSGATPAGRRRVMNPFLVGRLGRRWSSSSRPRRRKALSGDNTPSQGHSPATTSDFSDVKAPTSTSASTPGNRSRATSSFRPPRMDGARNFGPFPSSRLGPGRPFPSFRPVPDPHLRTRTSAAAAGPPCLGVPDPALVLGSLHGDHRRVALRRDRQGQPAFLEGRERVSPWRTCAPDGEKASERTPFVRGSGPAPRDRMDAIGGRPGDSTSSP